MIDEDEIDTMEAAEDQDMLADTDEDAAEGLDTDFSASDPFAAGAFGAEAEEDEGDEPAEMAAAIGPANKPDMNLIMDIPVTMQVVLGKAVMPVANLVKLGRGAVVKLDTNIGDPVDLIVNGRIVARGEVVVLENEDSRFGITLTEIVSPGAKPQRSKTSGA